MKALKEIIFVFRLSKMTSKVFSYYVVKGLLKMIQQRETLQGLPLFFFLGLYIHRICQYYL